MTKPPRTRAFALACALALATPLLAQEEAKPAPSPGEIVAQATASEWIAIAPEDLLVMTLAPDAAGKERKVVIQLMPAPFSQGWVENIRTLARDKWYDGIAVVRVQDNYVVQWGDPNGEDAAKAKSLPEGLRVMTDNDYGVAVDWHMDDDPIVHAYYREPSIYLLSESPALKPVETGERRIEGYGVATGFSGGFPVATNDLGRPSTGDSSVWPVHCYGMVGVGRNLTPDTGTGAELYTVIGHAPRHLDRNIALVGRVIEGIEHFSSLPRGTGPLGFYEDPAQRVPIVSIRVAADLPAAEQPQFQYLSTEGETFARYADARANRRDPFFNVPAGGADICNIPVPVRRVKQ